VVVVVVVVLVVAVRCLSRGLGSLGMRSWAIFLHAGHLYTLTVVSGDLIDFLPLSFSMRGRSPVAGRRVPQAVHAARWWWGPRFGIEVP